MFKMITTAIATVCLAGSVQAASILPGTAGIGFTTDFTVDTSGATGSFAASNAGVTVANTTGGFLTPNFPGFSFSFGTFDGTFTFSKSNGVTINQSLPSLLTFGDITFSADSVRTVSFVTNPGVSTSVSLYLLGTASKPTFDDTATSLTLSFNSTGSSAFSASATLATPPAAVPEPASWALMLGGFGAIGSALRSRRKSAVSFG